MRKVDEMNTWVAQAKLIAMMPNPWRCQIDTAIIGIRSFAGTSAEAARLLQQLTKRRETARYATGHR